MEQGQYEPLGVGAGTLIAGRYDIVRKIGAGGMAAVYQVRDRALNNEIVALKLFEPTLASDEILFKRFQNEVVISRKLTHPNIIRTYDFGDADGHHFMTMEYVKGVSLEKVIERQGGLSITDALRVLHEIQKGVAYAHEMGVIHRDLKPGNILISSDGEVKIADFGLARTQEVNMQLTQAGECVGTPHYMAPEQIQELETDHRVDLYAIGIMSYELVTGHVPFTEQSWFDLASKIIKEPIPEFSTKKNKIPEWFQEFVNKATAKTKEERFASAEDMMDILAEYIELDASGSPAVLELEPHRTQRQSLKHTMLGEALSGGNTPRISMMRLAPIMLVVSGCLFAGLFLFSLGDKFTKDSVSHVEQVGESAGKVVDQFHDLKDTMTEMATAFKEVHQIREQKKQAEKAASDASEVDGLAAEPEAAVESLVEPAPVSTPAAQ